MRKNLRKEGYDIGRDRARRLMKVLNLKVETKRKYKVTTDSKHRLPVAENVLNQKFSPHAPNQAWGINITYLWTRQETIADIREYVAVYYNSKRLHSTLEHISPVDYEKIKKRAN